MKSMPSALRSVIVACMTWLLCACVTVPDDPADQSTRVESAERIHLALASLEQVSDEIWYAGYESVEELGAGGVNHPYRYMLLDFRFYHRPDIELVQSSVSSICAAVYGNPPLVRDINNLGYEQVAVAFDDGRPIECQHSITSADAMPVSSTF